MIESWRFVATICLALGACGGGDGSDRALKAAPEPEVEHVGIPEVADLGCEAAPAGCATEGASTAGAVRVSWDATPNANVVGYRLYYGTAPGAYEQPKGAGIPVGNANSHLVEDLTRGQTFYFAVTAIDGAGGESAFSEEVVGTAR